MKIHVENFQSLKDASIDIGPLTVLIGSSDSGKSALIRALSLLHRNSGGLELVRHGTDKLKVSQTLTDGTVISIEKGKGINTYTVGDQKFSKVGRDIPLEVSEKLRTAVLVLDKDSSIDLTFARQFDPPFLLTESSSVVTKAISSLSGINIVYSAIREGNGEAQKLKAKSEVLAESLKNLIKYDSLYDESVSLQKENSNLVLNISARNSKVDEITTKISILSALEFLQNKDINVSMIQWELDDLLSRHSVVQAGLSRRIQLIGLLNRFYGISEYTLSDEFNDGIENVFSSTEKLLYVKDIIKEKTNKLSALSNILSSLTTSEKNEIGLNAQIDESVKEFNGIKAQIRVCPTCGKVV